MSDDTPTSDSELVERARRFDEHHPRALWPHTWKDAALREVARLRAEVERLTAALSEERAAKDEARKNLCRKVVMTARDLPVRVRCDDGLDVMCSDPAEVADAWGWGYLYPMTGPEAATASGVSTPKAVEGLLDGVRRSRGEPALGGVASFFGTLSSEQTDEEFLDMLEGETPEGEPT